MSRLAAYGGSPLVVGLRCWQGKQADVSLRCVLFCCFGPDGVVFIGCRQGRVLGGAQEIKACGGRAVGREFAMATGERAEMASRYVLSCCFRPVGAVFWAAVRPVREWSGD